MMRKYEYTSVEVDPAEGMSETLNTLGEVGWKAWAIEMKHLRFKTVACVFMVRETQDETITGEHPIVSVTEPR